MIQAAIKTGAAVIDLCSGIETAPGTKSEILMKEAYANSL
jgi:phosphoribosylanthranilate isomerase